MYVNGKMIPVETVPGVGRVGMKVNGEGGEFSMKYLVYCKNFCKCHNVPPLSTTIKKLVNVLFYTFYLTLVFLNYKSLYLYSYYFLLVL
jgi:hypothetical protein